MFQKVFEYAGPHKKGLYAATAIVLVSPFIDSTLAGVPFIVVNLLPYAGIAALNVLGLAAAVRMAQVTARMDVKDLKMELTGKSTATLTGAVRYLSLFVSTGKLEAAGLEVMAAEANVTSSGVAALWVTDRFQGKTSTGGKITYKGAPPIVRSGAKFMGGDITRVE